MPAQTTTTRTLVSPSPVKLTITQLVGGETLVTCQKIGGSSCLSAKDVQPVPGDPRKTIDKLQKVLSEAAQNGSSSENDKLLTQARQALVEAQKQVTDSRSVTSGHADGDGDKGAEPDNAQDSGTRGVNPLIGNYTTSVRGARAPQGVNGGSLSVFA